MTWDPISSAEAVPEAWYPPPERLVSMDSKKEQRDGERRTTGLKKEGQYIARDEDLCDPLVSDEGVTLCTSSSDEAPESHIDRRCKQCL